MKKSLIVLFGALALIVTGCAQHSARGGASDPEFAGISETQHYQPPPSGQQDYREVLAHPGHF